MAKGAGESAEKIVKDIRRKTRRRFSTEEKIRIALYQLGVGQNLISLKSSDLIQGKRRIVNLADQELEKRLLHDPAKPSMAELNMVSGTATGKLRDFEGWRSTGAHGGDGRQLSDILEKLGRALDGKRIGLIVEAEPPDANAIDVTPSEAN
jgi:hypothetical protein